VRLINFLSGVLGGFLGYRYVTWVLELYRRPVLKKARWVN